MAPASFWPVLAVSLSGLYFLLSLVERKRAAFLTGWLFGFGYFLFSLSWIGNALLIEGNGYEWAYPLAVSGIPFGLAFFWGLAGLCSYLIGRFDRWIGAFGFVACLMLFELARSYLFTGFPWNLMGYAWADVAQVRQFVALGSIFGLTALTFLWMTVPAFLMCVKTRAEKVGLLTLAVVSFFAVFVYGHAQLQKAENYALPNVAVKIVPGDIAQSVKWDRDLLMDHFAHYIEQSYPAEGDNTSKPTLIVWPETTMIDWYYTNPDLLRRITDMLQSYDDAVLISGALRQNDDEMRNSLVMIDSLGVVSNVYDKSHLVPFGEYIPFQDFIPLKPVNNFSGFVAGNGPEVFETPSGISYAPAICYEIIFPFSSLPASQDKPDFIINVTNDAWYEGSAGPYQHYVQVLFRAIEYKTPVIRAANMGVSGISDIFGRRVSGHSPQ